jgi:hypothetical protein
MPLMVSYLPFGLYPSTMIGGTLQQASEWPCCAGIVCPDILLDMLRDGLLRIGLSGDERCCWNGVVRRTRLNWGRREMEGKSEVTLYRRGRMGDRYN